MTDPIKTAIEDLEHSMRFCDYDQQFDIWVGIDHALTALRSYQERVVSREEIADRIDTWFRTGKDKPWNFFVEDLASAIYDLQLLKQDHIVDANKMIPTVEELRPLVKDWWEGDWDGKEEEIDGMTLSLHAMLLARQGKGE